MFRQILEELVLIGGDGQLLCPPHGCQGRKIQRQPAVAPAVRLGGGRGAAHPAQGHLHPPQQDLHVEGLGHIVLGSHVKAGQHVLFQVVGGQKDDRQIRPLLL